MNKDYLKHPNINSFIVGLVIGIPQGLMLKETHFDLLKSATENAKSLVLFGLFAPLLLTIVNMVLGRFKDKTDKKNFKSNKMNGFINGNMIVVWVCFSLSISATFTISSKDLTDLGYGISFLFASAGCGFLIANLLMMKLNKKTTSQ